ncbi:hypothetical protein [Actinotalea sp. K2]|uniref:hypothetical protein n=1 Tax=Actinotalea sp. K2 TaxID=2939438 RepID=UPI002017F72B|nr:hypothetical protein [Actinotalea sp. K2]MCL3861677.1 hypothetical protein [Actinotalea sp. K2]
MHLALPFTEALALATAREPLPPLVRSVRAEGSVVHAQIDLREIPDPSTALRFAAAAVGMVDVTVRFTGYDDGVATAEITAHARALPAHKLVTFLIGPINAALVDAGLPEGLVEVRRGSGDPVVAVRVQDAVDTRVAGVTVVTLDLHDAVLHVSAVIGTVRVL